MKQIIPFQKEIVFKSMINKITSISLEHNLVLKDDVTVMGDFIVSGSYKMTEASQIDEEFCYKIPIEIAIDSKYDTKNILLEIDDFTYEVLNEETLLLNIDLCIDNLELKQEEIETIFTNDEYCELDDTLNEIEEECLVREDNYYKEKEDLFLETNDEKIDIPVNINSINTKPQTLPYFPEENVNNGAVDNDSDNAVTSLFTAFKNADETFSTYSIYIMRENDNLDTVIDKYRTTKEALLEYNDLSDIRIGTKIIIPSTNE